MVIVRAAEPIKVGGGFCPNLFTDHHDEETERLTGLGAKLINEVYLTSDDHPTIRMTVLAGGQPVQPGDLAVRVIASPIPNYRRPDDGGVAEVSGPVHHRLGQAQGAADFTLEVSIRG